jgi:hypothetical protein
LEGFAVVDGLGFAGPEVAVGRWAVGLAVADWVAVGEGLAVGGKLAVGEGLAVGDRLAVGEGLAVVGEGDGEIDAVGVGLIVVGATGGVGFTSVEGDTVGAPGAPGAGFWGVFTFALYVS